MDQLERRKMVSDMWVSWVSLIGVAAAVVFGITEYLSAADERFSDKEKATLAFIERYNRDEMLVSRRKVNQVISQQTDLLVEEMSSVRSQAQVPEAGAKFFAENMNEALRKADAMADAELVIQFFDEVWVCVELNLCEESAAYRLFRDDAYQLSLALGSDIQRIQKTRPHYGLGVGNLRIDRTIK